jgi:hypothetical protein
MVTLRRSVLVGTAAVGALLAGFWLGRATPADAVTPAVRQGTVTLVDIDGTAFAVQMDGAGSPHSYAVPTLWIDAQGSHHDDGHPACLAPLSKGQHIVYGIVQIKPAHGADGTDLVAWVRCAAP